MAVESRVALDLAHAVEPPKAGVSNDAALYDVIGDASVVLIGEASHGTHEFYRARAEITKRLIAERGFTAVCIEGDWPDAYRVNRYVRGAEDDIAAIDSLEGFKRFPAWTWRNPVVLDFIGWLRHYNDGVHVLGSPKAGFYGLDLYSTYASIEAALHSLDDADPAAASRARRRYECLEPFEAHPERDRLACRDDVVAELVETQRQASRYAEDDGQSAADQYFYAEQNARVIARAEEYYRAMLDESVSIWSLRVRHMIATLQRLMHHLTRYRGSAKAVVWAHNSQTSIRALARDAFGDRAVSIGFTTYHGTVTAASEWHGLAECKRIVPARGDSYEYLFHSMNVPRFLVPLRQHRPKLLGLPMQARERAIGAVYRPQTELSSHYFTARLIDQFDAVYHFDTTRALEPLDRRERWPPTPWV